MPNAGRAPVWRPTPFQDLALFSTPLAHPVPMGPRQDHRGASAATFAGLTSSSARRLGLECSRAARSPACGWRTALLSPATLSRPSKPAAEIAEAYSGDVASQRRPTSRAKSSTSRRSNDRASLSRGDLRSGRRPADSNTASSSLQADRTLFFTNQVGGRSSPSFTPTLLAAQDSGLAHGRARRFQATDSRVLSDQRVEVGSVCLGVDVANAARPRDVDGGAVLDRVAGVLQ
jgi:hypothetical protein